MNRRTLIAMSACVIALPTSASAVTIGRVTTGWPKMAAAGYVVAATPSQELIAGSVVVAYASDVHRRTPVSLAAFAPTGIRGFLLANPYSDAAVERRTEPRLRAGGAIGPVSGLHVQPNGLPIDADHLIAPETTLQVWSEPPFTDFHAGKNGLSLWTYRYPYPQPEAGLMGDWPIIADGQGSLYIGFPFADDEPVTTPLIALDPINGTERWRRERSVPLAQYGNGVLAFDEQDGIVALDRDGDLIASFAPDIRPTTETIVATPVGNRTFFEILDSEDGWRLETFFVEDSSPDKQAIRSWSIGADRDPELVGWTPNTALIATTVSGRHILRAIHVDHPTGNSQWLLPTPTRVRGAAIASDGGVVITTESAAGLRDAGLAVRVDPTQRPIAVSRLRFSLSRTWMRMSCSRTTAMTAGCMYRDGADTILRMAVPRGTTYSVRLWSVHGSTKWRPMAVTAGVSHVRLAPPRPGSWRVQVRRGTNGVLVMNKAITVVP